MNHEEDELGQAYDARLMRRLLGYLSPYKRYVIAALALTVLGGPLVVAAPPLVRAAVDLYLLPDAAHPPDGYTLLIKQAAESLGFGGRASSGIAFIALLLVVANLAAMVVLYAEAFVLQRMGQHIMFDLRNQIFEHLQRLPLQYYDRHPVGRLMTRMTSDVEALNELFSSVVIAIFGDATMLLYVVFWMFLINWRLALVALLILPPMIALTVWFRRRSRKAFRSIRMHVARINTFLQERLTGMSVVQLFNRERRELRNFTEINDEYRKANLNTIFYNAVFFPAVEIIAAAGIALILWYGGGQVVQGVVTLGTVIAFLQMAEMFYEPIGDLSERYNLLQSAMSAAERIFQLLDEPITIQSPEEPTHVGRVRGRIEFRNVWFAYKDEDWVLKDVSFLVQPGESVAFVGHTGAGKSTITNLLLRFYDIQRGQILLDGVDIRKLDLAELRANFSIVLQDVFLFTGNIASNIRLGNTTISDEQVREAARQVNAGGFINRLSNGYATDLYERGAGISVGQKQLISFARALAFDPRVLIMDEATSSIDTETEVLLHDAVKRLMAGRTSLIIAHRLSTVQAVDNIIVIHKGEVRESGTHQELLRQRGLYWLLYRLSLFQTQQEELVESMAAK
ncbi:MAG TPA: ABC transporter ATP-binding protein [Pyrinomonadaceae bacterium]|jgi:ATP-binding cassette subfamily B protein|nr:ABC transporter ATP-binding protein [Pyrinomonadaceae bacterium]